MQKQNEMTQEPIFKLLLKFSIPAITGLLVNALYNIVDAIFVGRGVGEMALAGVTVIMPLMTIMMAFTFLFSMGATALISMRLGEKRQGDAEAIVGNAFVLFVIMSFIFIIIGLLFLEPILLFFGAGPNVLPYAMDYAQIIIWGSLFFVLSMGMNNFIRAEGNPNVAMQTMLIGAVTNIILDYVFIFIFHWGIKGAAIATVIAYMVSNIWIAIYFLSGKSLVKFRRENIRIHGDITMNIIRLGIPMFAMQVTSSVQQLILNRSLVAYGGDMALSAIGIIMSVTMFIIMPVIGISHGAQPIIGFNKGAKEYKRVRQTLVMAIGMATFVATLGYIGANLWPGHLVSLFNKNPDLIDMTIYGLVIYIKAIPLVGLQIIGTSYFQAVGQAVPSTILGLSRQIIVYIPVLLILPIYMGLDGIWWAAPASDLGAFILTGTWLLFELRKLKREEDNLLAKI